MGYSNDVISVRQGSAKLNRPLWSFSYPHEVVTDPNMDQEEKRAILAAWASDEHAVDSMPTLRHLPGTPFPVTFSSIMDARLQFDRMENFWDDDPPASPNKVRMCQPHLPLRKAASCTL